MNRPRDVERSGTLATAGCPWLALDLLGARVDQAWFSVHSYVHLGSPSAEKLVINQRVGKHDDVPHFTCSKAQARCALRHRAFFRRACRGTFKNQAAGVAPSKPFDVQHSQLGGRMPVAESRPPGTPAPSTRWQAPRAQTGSGFSVWPRRAFLCIAQLLGDVAVGALAG